MDSMKKIPKINRNIILSIILLLGIAFSVVNIVMATAPDPGHNFTESSGNLTLGDLIYGSGADTAAALAGNITVTKKFLNQTGNGSVSAAPVWSILGTGDIPDISGTYSVKAGNTSLVTVGTIGTGTWNADVIADGKIASALTGKTYNGLTITANGTNVLNISAGKTLTVTGDATISGTPLSNPMNAVGDMIYGGTGGAATKLIGAAGFLKGGVLTVPAWSTINLAAAADVGTSILPVANGGTALSTFGGANTVLYTSAANTLTNVGASTVAGQFLQTTAAGGAPTWLTTLGVANGGTGNVNGTANIAGGTLGAIPYQSAANTTAILAANATANKVLMSGASAAPTWSTPTYPTTAGTSGNVLTSDGTNWTSTAPSVRSVYNQSVTTPAAGFAADTYLVGSSVAIPATGLRAGTRYHLLFQASKTAAGLATPILTIRFGTAGAIGDVSRCAMTWTAGTAATDTGTFEVWATFRTVGSGTSAVIQCTGQIRHGASITGFVNLVSPVVATTGGGFDSTVASSIVGTSVNGGTSAAWTITLVQAELTNLP